LLKFDRAPKNKKKNSIPKLLFHCPTWGSFATVHKVTAVVGPEIVALSSLTDDVYKSYMQ